jgi:thiol-disulfide isomerase/thioredoxin
MSGKRTSRPRSAARSRPSRRPAPRWLPLALVAGTVLVLCAFLVFALNKGSQASQAPALTPVPSAAASGTPLPTPITQPLPGIGIIDPASGRATVAKSAPRIGATAPDFAWQTPAGRTHLAALRGKTVLLEFYGVWCPACQAEVPWLDALQAKYSRRGLTVMSVTGSPYGINWEATGSTAPVSMDDLAQYRTRFGVQYQQVLDPRTRVFNLYGFGASFPTYWIIDKHGRARFTISTAISQQSLEAQVKAAL